jgi:hypothetical protein
MGHLILHSNPNPEKQEMERAKRFMALSSAEKWNATFSLIYLTMRLNNGKPLKTPQGKGVVLRKIKKLYGTHSPR